MPPKSQFNNELFLLALGIIQPASAPEVFAFLKAGFHEVQSWPSIAGLSELVRQLEDRDCVAAIGHGCYSLTRRGNELLGVKSRHIRDKLRLSLLRQCHDASLTQSEAGVEGLGGDAPSLDASSSTKEAPRPVRTGPVPSRQEATRHRAGTHWPRVVEQLSKVGLVTPASDSSRLAPPRYYSYRTLASLQRAGGGIGPDRDMTLQQLALAIGISPRLISAIIHQRHKHYREFELPKKGGGTRAIHAPRFFLKTVQYWLATYALTELRTHPCCHAYLRGKSILTNAQAHVGKAYVGNLDIRGFFDSVTTRKVKRMLVSNGIGPQLAATVSELCTFESCLPQGAPTSPPISNAVLFEVDLAVDDACSKLGVTYTRYADDITLSADNSDAIKRCARDVERCLRDAGYELNLEKTRIASSRSSQRVTGLVVNSAVRPPRRYRRNVRSAFHHAENDESGAVSAKEIRRLRGHLSYLRSFGVLTHDHELIRYSQLLGRLSVVPDGDTTQDQ